MLPPPAAWGHGPVVGDRARRFRPAGRPGAGALPVEPMREVLRHVAGEHRFSRDARVS
jgi:hypothetical protein